MKGKNSEWCAGNTVCYLSFKGHFILIKRHSGGVCQVGQSKLFCFFENEHELFLTVKKRANWGLYSLKYTCGV